MDFTVSVELGPYGGSALYGWFRMHRMSGLSLALHWHLCVWLLQLHGSSQFGTIFLYACPSNFLAFTSMKQRDLALGIRAFAHYGGSQMTSLKVLFQAIFHPFQVHLLLVW
jgi:hypothetical protein